MAQAYIPPGVSVDELLAPSFAAVLAEPTSICLIGPSQGFESHSELTTLDDNHSYTLKAKNADVSTLSIVDANNITLDPFIPDDGSSENDYTIDTSLLATTGAVSVARAMQTEIEDDEAVVVYYENQPGSVASQGNSFTDLVTLSGTEPHSIPSGDADLAASTVKVQKAGVAPTDDYTVAGAGTGTVTIVWESDATVLRRYQTVWVDYTVDGVAFADREVQLNNASTVSLPANSEDHVVKTAEGISTTITAAAYDKGTTTDLDWVLTSTGASATISRSAGTTNMGVDDNRIAVRITYEATPDNYWVPTRLFSVGDVEDKYGSAFNDDGTINSAVSFASLLAFQNGASDIVIQALFADGEEDGDPKVSPTGVTSDWEDTFVALRDIEDVNVLVPLHNTGGLVNNDAATLAIFHEARKHIEFMQTQDQRMVAILGEDATSASRAEPDTIQTHAIAVANASPSLAENMAMLTPGSFLYNATTGTQLEIGGQYVAAAIAGMMAARGVEETLTRKQVGGIAKVAVPRSEREKNTDASYGLMVVEERGNIIRVRHALTLAAGILNTSTAQRELNVVRAKHFMMENVKTALDEQVVGNIPADANAPFTVQLVVSSVLEQLVGDRVIVGYSDVQVRRSDVNNPSVLEVRFTYAPSFPLNYVNVKFSVDATSGIISTTTEGA